jgi:hypothetical protein
MRRLGEPTWRLCTAGLCLSGLSACSSPTPPAAPPQPPAPAHLSHDEIVRGDLASIIALQGSPCGAVVEFVLDERLQYRVICETGDSYRIRVSAARHVTADPHEWPGRNTRSPDASVPPAAAASAARP